MKKGTRKGFNGPFKQEELPLPIEPTILQDLVAKLRAGDASVGPTIIGGHMRLCMSVVAKYAHKYPYITDDLVGAAMYGLVQAVDWAKERMYDNNITPYIHQTCERFVREFVEDRLPIRIPRNTYSDMKQDRDAFVPLINSLSQKFDEDNPEYSAEYMNEPESRMVEENPILFEELLESLALPARDKIIVDMLMDGYSLQEVANYFGESKQLVSLWKQKIGNQILRRSHASYRTKRKIVIGDTKRPSID
jgi:RNA polymerase sigma factor (sigma-70 family)